MIEMEERTPIEELTSVSQILHLAHHRNKNQHRLAKWWKSFSQLRRQIPKFVTELEALNTAISFSSSEENKYVKTAREKVESRVEFWREFLMPKCYVAFGNLVADGQYAVLGLMLIGILARVRTVLISVVLEEETAVELVIHEESESEKLADQVTQQDLGEVVKRDEIESPLEEAPDQDSEDRDSEEKSKKRRKTGKECAKRAVGSTPKKSKKKRKKGDAFDDLFNSLI